MVLGPVVAGWSSPSAASLLVEITAPVFPGLPAALAPLGRIGKTLFMEELLLAGAPRKGRAAVGAGVGLVLVFGAHFLLPFFFLLSSAQCGPQPQPGGDTLHYLHHRPVSLRIAARVHVYSALGMLLIPHRVINA